MRTFIRMVLGLVVFAMVMSAMGLMAQPTYAQSRTKTNVPGSWASAIVIQNIGTANLASGQYNITFYDANGDSTDKTFTPSVQIDRFENGQFYVPSFSSLAGGQYSAVISSSQKVKAVVNSSTDAGPSGPWSAYAYEGIDAADTATTIYFPAFYKRYYNFISELVIQNAGTNTATIEATFYNSATGAMTGPIALGTIPANASSTFAWNDSAFSALSINASYNVIITSKASGSVPAQPIAGISNIWNYNTSVVGVGSYSAVTGGATTIYTPALYNQFYGFVSALTIQNMGSETVTGTIYYSDANNTTQAFTIPGNQSRMFYQPADSNLSSGANGSFGARIVADRNIAAVVNIERKSRTNINIADPTNPAFGSYNGLTTLGTTVYVPAVYYDYYKYFTALSVTNYSTDTSATVTVTYATGQTWTQTIPAGQSRLFSHLPSAADNPLDRTNPAQRLTNATVTSTEGVPLAVIIQHNTDVNMNSYNPAMIPNDYLFVSTGISAE